MVHCVVDNPFLNPNCNSDEHNEYSSLNRIIQSKILLKLLLNASNRPIIARTT